MWIQTHPQTVQTSLERSENMPSRGHVCSLRLCWLYRLEHVQETSHLWTHSGPGVNLRVPAEDNKDSRKHNWGCPPTYPSTLHKAHYLLSEEDCEEHFPPFTCTVLLAAVRQTDLQHPNFNYMHIQHCHTFIMTSIHFWIYICQTPQTFHSFLNATSLANLCLLACRRKTKQVKRAMC